MDKSHKIGGLWVSESKAGRKYMSGSIEIDGEKFKIAVFRNDFKKPGDKSPDYTILCKELEAASAPPKADDFSDDIPF